MTLPPTPPSSPFVEEEEEEEETPPSTPPSSPGSDVEEEESSAVCLPKPTTEDQLDAGVLSSTLQENIKAGIIHLLNIVLQEFRREICFGCQVDHPSQTNHECLFEVPSFFYRSHFHRLMRRLWTPKFIPALQQLLTSLRISVDKSRIQGAAEAMLHDLRSCENIFETIGELYDSLVGEDIMKIALLRMVADTWRGA